MNEDDDALTVAFEIDFRDSFGNLRTLEDMIGEGAINMMRQLERLETASAGAINFRNAIAETRKLTEGTREYTREQRRVEAAGEALSRQLSRQNAEFGKNRDQIRAAKVEAQALAAANLGLTEQADRLRAQQAALVAQQQQAASARLAEAAATERAAREQANFAAMVRASQAAQEADAAAAERLRLSTDPLYAATVRLNAEIAESTRLYYAGATAQSEYERQQGVLTGQLRAVEEQQSVVNRGLGSVGAQGRLAGHHMQNLAFQFQDVGIQMFAAAQSSEPFKMAIMAIVQQGAQIGGIMAQAGVGLRAVGVAFLAMSRDILIAAATNPIILGIAATVGVLVAAVKGLQSVANDGGPVEAYAKSLGLTAKEIKQLDNVTVTFGDTAKAVFQVAGRAIWDQIGPAVTSTWNMMKEWLAWIGTGVKGAVNFLIGGFVGAYNVITKQWQAFPAVIGDIFYSGVNAAIGAINSLLKAAVDGINALAAKANAILPAAMQIPTLKAAQIDSVNNQYAGAFKKFGATAQAEMKKAMGVDYVGNVAGAIARQAQENAFGRVRAQAEEKGFLDADKAAGAKAKELSDAQKAYEAAVKAAKEYAAAQLDEAAKIGLSAKQLRLYADAAAMAKAPTDGLKLAIAAAAAVREKTYSAQAAKDFQANVMQPLRDELALYGLVGPAREQAALELEKQAFIAKNMDDGIVVATARWVEYYNLKSQLIANDAAAAQEAENIGRMREEFEALIEAAREAGDAIARSFGRIGGAVGDVIQVLTEYQKRQMAIEAAVKAKNLTEAQGAQASARLQIQGYTAMAGAAKGFFKQGSDGYKAMAAAEKAFALVQLANTAVNVAAGAAKMFASLGPFAFPAVAAMIGVMAALGFSKGGGGAKAPETNQGTGTVLGDSAAKSESITRALNQLRDIDTVMLSYSRQMAASLRTIENEIGGFASLLVRNAESINANGGVKAGFNSNAGTTLAGIGFALGGPIGAGIGALLTKIPVVGDLLKGLFGTKTSILGSGLFGGAQSIGNILNGGFDASYFTDIQKKKKFFGITTSNKTSTQYTGADPLLENQFTLILRSFNDAILAAAGPLGASTSEIQQKLNSFVVSIGKIDLQGLTGEQIEEKLTAVFGAAADSMASAAFPLITQFQKAGEGAFETLVRVASTLEAVSGSLDMLGQNAQGMSIAMKLGLADQFESVSALTGAVDAYFQAFYTKEEQAAARTAQMASVFQSLGLAMPTTLAGFRQLVEAQNLNTVAGQATYATLLKLAPAFAELQAALEGAKSAADIASEKADLQRQLLELNGDTAALRALQLAKLDASNRALQQQIWAIQDAQAAAKAAEELRKAWTSVGDSIFDEIQRIRGLTAVGAGSSFAALQSQFNAATLAARGGDMDAAKSLPQLSQALLAAAADAATSRQELDRIRAQTAAALEATYGLISQLGGNPAATNAALLNAGASSQPGGASNDNGSASLAASIEDLRADLAAQRAEHTAALTAIAANTGKTAKTLENVTADSGGDAVSTRAAA